MPIDVLLTYPSDGLRLFSSMIPIGLASLGTVLRNNGYSVKIVDFNHYHRDFRRDLFDWQPRIVAIGGTTPTRMGSFLTAKLAKRVLPGCSIVYGGVNASFTAAEVLRDIHQIDYVIMGEGEFPLLKLCDALIRKTATDLSQIKGLCYRSPNGMHSSSPERIQDLSLLPISDRSLFSNNYYTRMEFLEGSGDFIITSRGCPAACNFCAASKMFPGGVRYRNMDHVASEIEYLQSRQKLSGLKIFDSTFTASRDHVEAFCKMVKPFKMKWECEIRADTVDYNLLRLMNDAGCYYINMGMETTNPEHLKKIAKGITPRQVLSVLDMCTDIGIFTKVFFTFGHINQTFRECLDDIRFIEENKARIHFFAITVGMRIYPGTRLEKTCKEIKQYPRSFSYTKPYHSLKKLLVGEPSDVPILFQKKLNAHHMFFIICFLLLKGLYCTKAFLIAMAFSNVGIFIKSLYIRYCYTVHRSRRIRDFILKKGMYITE